MKILVTGGGGVIGAGLLPELLRQGHSVRLLSRGAEGDVKRLPEGAEAFSADITKSDELRGAAADCGAIIHIAGIVEETAELSFDKVNVDGTRHILAEATSANVQRFIYLSSLGAERGSSKYHHSKLRAEEAVQSTGLDWTIVRPGNVYGPGDEVMSMLLKMVRSLPVAPVVGDGEQRFQPIWFEDLGKAICALIDDARWSGKIVELAGDDVTTTRDVIAKLSAVTGRNVDTASVPTKLVSAATRLVESVPALGKVAEKAGLPMPISASKLQMLLDENVIQDGSVNELTNLVPERTSLDEGLRRLANELPELLPEEGVGAMGRKVFTVEIEGGRWDAAGLLEQVRARINEVMPIEFAAEPGAPSSVKPDAALTGEIPGRGHFQVRALEVNECEMTFLTVEGHPMAGMVSFRAEDLPGGVVRFVIETDARASNVFDWMALRTVGGAMQDRNWRGALERIVELSGGHARGEIQHESAKLSNGEAEEVNQRAKELSEAKAREAVG